MLLVPATIDFETRSACDLRKSGAFKYAEHETTEIMCLAVRYNGIRFVWNPAYDRVGIPERNRSQLEAFFTWVKSGGIILAFNAGFERAIWNGVGVKRLGWPKIKHEQWRCSAALAASYALPRSLEGAANALGLDQRKDDKGARVMKKISKPRLPLKADMVIVAQDLLGDGERWKEIQKPKDMFEYFGRFTPQYEQNDLCMWHEKAEELEMLFAYCMQDVDTEHSVSERLHRGLDENELAVWQLDQLMNETGVQIDMDLVDTALRLAERCRIDADARIKDLTGGAVATCTQRNQFLAWINGLGEGFLPNTQKSTIEEAIESPAWGPIAREALTVRLNQAKTSTKKYASMKNVACEDGRARGLLYYYGADTGRWAGRLIQPQNFPRGSVKGSIDMLCDTILRGDREEIEMMYCPTMEALSSALRGAMIAGPGKDLICSDYSAIEARGTFWIAEDQVALDVLSSGRDIYIDMASQIYGIPYDQIDKSSIMRQIGKQAILGLGYQMGAERYVDTCAGYGIEMDFDMAKKIVQTYRRVHAPVRSFWYDIERATREAVVRGKGADPVLFKRLKIFVTEDDFLQIQLPSGRKISYYEPRIIEKLSKWQDYDEPPVTDRDILLYETHQTALAEGWSAQKCQDHGLRVDSKITFMGVNSQTRKFYRQETYGGKLTENVVQGLSRDIMAEAMLRVYRGGKYMPLLTVHDEIVAEVAAGQGDVEEFENELTVLPTWAKGFPVEASDGWVGKRYRK